MSLELLHVPQQTAVTNPDRKVGTAVQEGIELLDAPTATAAMTSESPYPSSVAKTRTTPA